MRKVLLMGDSHTKYFTHAARKGMLGQRDTRSCVVFGATARGLTNPQSRTGALNQYNDFLCAQPKRSILLCQLGEVDCGFVIWYLAQKYARCVETQMSESLESYFSFIDDVRKRFGHTLIVTGATIPTIRDGTDWGEVAHLRQEVTASLSARTGLTLAFNEQIRARCRDLSIPYVDISQTLLDPESGVVGERFRNPDEADHHLNKKVVAPLWADALNPVLAQLGA